MAVIKVFTNRGRLIREFRSEDYNMDHTDPRVEIPVEQNTFAQLTWDIAQVIRQAEQVQQGGVLIDEVYGEYPNFDIDNEGDLPPDTEES